MLGLLSKLVSSPAKPNPEAAGAEGEDFYFEELLPLLQHDCLRVVFYQERAGQGSAELLFDSHASRGRDKASDKDKGKDGAKAADAAPSPLKKLPPSLGEMIFGTMPMSLEGRSSKMHFLPSLDLVLISRLVTLRLRQGFKMTFAVGALFDIKFRDFLLWHFGSGVEREVDHLLRHFLRTVLSPDCPTSLEAFQTEPNLVRAVSNFQTAFNRLVSAPRLDRVLWVNIFAGSVIEERREAASDFLRTLEAMRARWDSPRSGYFLSTLVTSLLATDLSWTLSFPSHTASAPSSSSSSSSPQTTATTTHHLPSSRTILTGLGPSHLRPLLALLSYFIRPRGSTLPSAAPLQHLLSAHEACEREPGDAKPGEEDRPVSREERRDSIGALEEASASVAHLSMLSLQPRCCDNELGEGAPGSSAAALELLGSILPSRCTLSQTLFASYLPYYSDHFVLMAMGKLDSEADFTQRVQHDLKARTAQAGQAYCLLADVANLRCQVFCQGSSAASATPLSPRPGVPAGGAGAGGAVVTMSGRTACSDFVRESLVATEGLWKAGLPPEGCIQYLEDRLQQLLDLSRMLGEYLGTLPVPQAGQAGTTLAEAASRLGLTFPDANLLLSLTLATAPTSLRSYPLAADGVNLPTLVHHPS